MNVSTHTKKKKKGYNRVKTRIPSVEPMMVPSKLSSGNFLDPEGCPPQHPIKAVGYSIQNRSIVDYVRAIK